MPDHTITIPYVPEERAVEARRINRWREMIALFSMMGDADMTRGIETLGRLACSIGEPYEFLEAMQLQLQQNWGFVIERPGKRNLTMYIPKKH